MRAMENSSRLRLVGLTPPSLLVMSYPVAGDAKDGSAVLLSNAQLAKDYTTVGVVLAGVGASLVYEPSRLLLASIHAGSGLGAASLYVAGAALVYVCYTSLKNTSEWRGGGVTGILSSAEGKGFHGGEVDAMATGYFNNFGEESRSVHTGVRYACVRRGCM
jgi:hypothetical protein